MVPREIWIGARNNRVGVEKLVRQSTLIVYYRGEMNQLGTGPFQLNFRVLKTITSQPLGVIKAGDFAPECRCSPVVFASQYSPCG